MLLPWILLNGTSDLVMIVYFCFGNYAPYVKTSPEKETSTRTYNILSAAAFPLKQLTLSLTFRAVRGGITEPAGIAAKSQFAFVVSKPGIDYTEYKKRGCPKAASPFLYQFTKRLRSTSPSSSSGTRPSGSDSRSRWGSRPSRRTASRCRRSSARCSRAPRW